MTIRSNVPESDGQKTFGVFGCRSQKSSNPHPEQSAGTSCDDGSCHTDDIAGPDRGRQGGAECSKAGYLAVLSAFFIGGDIPDRLRQSGNLQCPQPDCQENANDQNQANQR